MQIITSWYDEENVEYSVRASYVWESGSESDDGFSPPDPAVVELFFVERSLHTFPPEWTFWDPPAEFEDELVRQCWEDFNQSRGGEDE